MEQQLFREGIVKRKGKALYMIEVLNEVILPGEKKWEFWNQKKEKQNQKQEDTPMGESV